MKQLLFLALLCFACHWVHLHAQTTKVIFLVHPAEAVVTVDGQQVMPLGKWLELPIGRHSIRITAKTYLPKDTLFDLQSGDGMKFQAALKHEPAFLEYEAARRYFVAHKSFSIINGCAIPVAVGFGVLAHRQSRIEMDKFLSKANQMKALYNSTVGLKDLESYRTKYNDMLADYKGRYNRMMVRTIGIGVAVAGLSVLCIRSTVNVIRSGKPEYVGVEQTLGVQFHFGYGDISPLSISAKLQF